MTVKELLIKFQEYQLEYKVLNANCAHNAAANLFMKRYGVKNCSIPDVMESVCSCSRGKGIDHDEDGKAYCIDCGNYLEQTVP